jgi:CelD/BcsL family acetyltransferase involved in cellulose biosynthesis
MTRIDPSLGLVATLGACPEPTVLAPLWRELEARSDASFFLSWNWIGTMVATFGRPALLATVRRDGVVVGLALFGRRNRWWDPLRSPALHLNETGRADCDAVTIEYNAVLAQRGAEAAAIAAVLQTLTGWRELHLSGVAPAMADACRGLGLQVRLRRQQLAPYADLGDGDPLETLSRNSRQQIKRSLRLYEERGPLALDRAADAVEAWHWLDDLATLHTAAWQARGKPGAFANPHFRPFHRRLAAEGVASGVVDLLRVRAGEDIIGMLYNFRHGDHAYSYQSGFRFEEDERLKPGLVSHVMAMRHYQSQGLARYCFLAGDSRYKSTLATGKDELLWLTAHREDFPHRVEAMARRLLRRA